MQREFDCKIYYVGWLTKEPTCAEKEKVEPGFNLRRDYGALSKSPQCQAADFLYQEFLPACS
jgi:hypothetical protein